MTFVPFDPIDALRYWPDRPGRKVGHAVWHDVTPVRRSDRELRDRKCRQKISGARVRYPYA